MNKIILGHALNVLPRLQAESVSCVTTSPPYWGLRDYGIEPVIWDGDKDCKHIWGNKIVIKSYGNVGTHPNVGNQKINAMKGSENKGQFCQKCGGWKGSLGLEPDFNLYVKHLCDIFDGVKRVLRKDGTCWVNLGDTYGGSGGDSGKTIGSQRRGPHGIDTRPVGISGLEGNQKLTKGYEKCLLDIPYRFSIEMTNRGWIKRNTIIWWKPNCMPSSADDRFTIDFEYLFFFTKNNKAIFWTNEKTLECVSKKPLGVKGIEGKDWEWRECPNCKGTGKVKVNIIDRPEIYGENDPAGMRKGRMRDFLDKKKDMYQAGDKPCKRCKELGKIKYSFWTGHDYWFEQQFEEHLTQENRPNGIIRNRIFGYDSKLNKLRGYKIKEQNKELERPQYHGKDINYGRQGRNKRCIWIDNSNYEIIVNDENGENIFKVGNIPQEEIIKCFGHWFNNEQNIKGTTWKISTKPFPEAHFAVYPEGLIEIPIKAGCPEFICKKCGKAKVKIYKSEIDLSGENFNERQKKIEANIKSGGEKFKRDYLNDPEYRKRLENKKIKIIETDCGCNAGFESGIVLDPFMGAGTTAKVAIKQRKRFIGIEIKKEYIEMSKRGIAKVQRNLF